MPPPPPSSTNAPPQEAVGAFVEGMPGAVALLSPALRVEAASAGFRRLLGAPGAEPTLAETDIAGPLLAALGAGHGRGTAHVALGGGAARTVRWEARAGYGGLLVSLEPADDAHAHAGTNGHSASGHAAPPPDNVAGRLRRYTERLSALHRLGSTHYASLDALIRAHLEAGCALFGMDAGVVSEVHGDACTFRAAYPDLPASTPGAVYPMSTMYCTDVVAAGHTIAHPDTSATERLRTHPSYDGLGVRAYFGTPVEVNGGSYGVLFFVAFSHRPDFDEHDRELLELMAQRIGHTLDVKAAEAARAESQSALRASEDLLARAQSIARLGSWEFDAATGEVRWSEEMYRIFGVEPGAPVSLGLYRSLIHPDDHPALQAAIARALADGSGYTIRHRIRRADTGEERWLQGSGTRSAEGRLTGIGLDVTDEARATQALRARELELREAQRIAHVGSWSFDAATEVLTLSDEVYRIFGLAPAATTPLADVLARYAPDDLPRVRAHIERALTTREPVMETYRILRAPTGDVRNVVLSSETVEEHGRLRMVGTIHDVTEVHRLAERLQEAETRFRLVADHATNAVTRTSASGRVLYVSPAVRALLGYEPDEFVGTNRMDHVHPDDLRRLTAAMVEGDDLATAEYRVRRKDGRYVWVETQRQAVEVGEDGASSVIVATTRSIEDRKAAEFEREASRDLLASLLESSLDGVMVFEAVREASGAIGDFRWVLANPHSERVTGHDPAGLIGETLLGVFPGNREAGLFDAYRAVVETGEPYQTTLRYPLDGLDVWLSLAAVRVGDGFSVTFRDVTEAKTAEAAVKASRDLLARVLESSLDAVWALEAVRDEAGRIVDFTFLLANGRSEQMVGLGPDDLFGRRYLDVYPTARTHGFFEAYARVVETGEPYADTVWYEGEGLAAWYRIVVVKVGDGFATTFRDVTADRDAETALRDNEERFRLLAENASDLVCLHEPGEAVTFRYLSPSVERVLGYAADELVGTSPLALLHPEDAARIAAEAVAPLLAGRAPGSVTYRMRRKDGAYTWLESASQPVLNEAGAVVRVQSASRDVSERVRAEGTLAQANRVLELRNRELQDFAYVASHDLQEPLRKIRAFADLLVEDHAPTLDEQARHYLARMQDAAGRMSRLIADLLSFSRVTTKARPFERTRPDAAARDALNDLEMAIEERAAVVEVEPIPDVDADPSQLRQLFQNLIGNALKFQQPGVTPRVRVSGRAVVLAGGVEGVEIAVEDNGIGFDEKYLDRIFTPFQRLHNRTEYAGTGIGLAICRRIAERHGGAITARSHEGEGTTFIVSVPRYHSPSEVPLT